MDKKIVFTSEQLAAMLFTLFRLAPRAITEFNGAVETRFVFQENTFQHLCDIDIGSTVQVGGVDFYFEKIGLGWAAFEWEMKEFKS